MRSIRRKAAIAVSIVAASSLVAGGVVAATRVQRRGGAGTRARTAATAASSAGRRAAGADDARREAPADPAALRRAGQPTTDARRRRRRRVQPHRPGKINELQHIAVEQSRLHIPILFAYDTIHGYRTIFPIPLGDGEQLRPGGRRRRTPRSARARPPTVGIKQIYSPMVDVSHEPRWGRIAEGGGEDPYLGSVMAAARVKGAQGSDYSGSGQGRRQRQALRRLRPARGRPRLQHDRHVRAAAAQPLPAAVQGRGRRRRGHRDVLVQRDQRRAGLRRTSETETDILKKRVGLRRLHRERLHGGRRDARVPAEERPTPARAATASPPTARTPAALALNAGTDSEMVSTYIRDYGEQLRRPAARSRWRGSTTRCAASCA